MSTKRSLTNWIVRDNDADGHGVIKYTEEEWCTVVEGPAFISTIIIGNENEDLDEEALQIRLADKAGKTVMLLEPKVPMPRLTSDRFREDSLVIREGQFLQFKPSIKGIHILVSGAKL